MAAAEKKDKPEGIDLSEIITPPTIERIYSTYVERNRPWEGWNLSIGAFGDECDRALWYGWRWAAPIETFSGKKLRLFQTGHREEKRMLEDLSAAGVEVVERNAETGKQFAVSAFGGHLQGRLDGVGLGFLEAPKTPHVIELKTHNEKSFKDLVKKGVKAAKPGHYYQALGYMHLGGYERAYYLAHNKNTDDLYSERISYDPVDAAQMMARAERIFSADRPPARIVEDPNSKAAFACRWCKARAQCHEKQFARIHCRTCLSSSADLTTGEWRCEFHGTTLGMDEQKAGCSSHLFIPDLVPGEQLDVDLDARTVTYRLEDGSTWIDGAKKNAG